MIDIHCHILHELDDGAKNIEEAVEMARQACEDGISHIIATPHFTNGILTYRDIVAEKIRQLQHVIDEQKIAVTIHPGNEVRLENNTFIREHIEKKSFFYLGGQEKFLLMEQRWAEYDPVIVDFVHFFISQGVTPIIAHPERHPYIRKQPELLQELIDIGAWTQVSVDSMLGKNNEEAQAFAFTLLDQDLVHTIATDAHNTVRKPNLSEGYRLIEQRAGATRVQDIMNRIQTIIA